MATVYCLLCKAPIEINQTPQMGQPVECAQCHSQFEIVWLLPLEIAWPEEDLSVQKKMTSEKQSKQETR